MPLMTLAIYKSLKKENNKYYALKSFEKGQYYGN
jgi:hypothetical protein